MENEVSIIIFEYIYKYLSKRYLFTFFKVMIML